MELRQFKSTVPLRQLCVDIIDCPHSTPTWTSHGVVVLRNQNIRNGRLDLTDASYTDEANFTKRTQRAMPAYGDLVITREAPMGEVCIIPVGLRCCLGQRMVLLRPDSQVVESRYLLYAIQSSVVQDAIRIQGGTGSTVSNLRIPVLSALEIPLPPTLAEQQAIAGALSDADALIEALEQLIAKKRQVKQGAMQELLTGKRRLPGFSGEWEVKRLGDIAEIVMGQSPSSAYYNTKGEGLPLIQGNADISNRETIKRVFTTEITKRGRHGDILMSVRAPVGEIARATFDICLGRGVCAIRHPNDFLYHTMIAKEPTWAKLSKGSTFDAVNSTDVKAFEIGLPVDEKEQTAIAAVLSDMDAEIAALEARLAKTRLLKQGMMQELLTGRIRLL